MTDRRPNGREGEKGRINRSLDVRSLEQTRNDWYSLDAVDPADLDSDFLGAVEEQPEDQERPELEGLSTEPRRGTIGAQCWCRGESAAL